MSRDIYTSETNDEIYVKVRGGFTEVSEFCSTSKGRIWKWSELWPVAYRETVDRKTLEKYAYGALTLGY